MKKKKILIIIVLFTITGLIYGKGFVGINGKVLFPTDNNYKDIYGNSAIYPEFELGLNIYKGVMIVGGYGFFSKEGKTIGELKIDTKSNQKILKLGIGYGIDLGEKLKVIVKGGISNISYKEEAMGESLSGNKTGIMLGGDILYSIGDRFYTKGIIEYISSKDTKEGVDIKLGGFCIGIGLGVRF